MTYDEVIYTVCNSTASDWIRFDERGVLTYREDLDLRIERRHAESETADGEPFTEGWATGHPDPDARKRWYEVCYRCSPVRAFALVSVNGGEAELPLPDPHTGVIERERYLLARPLDWMGTLDDYIERSGLTVGP